MINSEDYVLAEVRIPRSQIVERPRAVTQRTSLAVLGLAPREYLATIRAYRSAGGTGIDVGRSRVAIVDDLLAWLARRSAAAQMATAAPRDPQAELGAELGLRVVAGGRR